MAITKETVYDAVTIRATGHVEIRMATVYSEDGEELTRKFFRRVIEPTDNITNEPLKIRQICAIARSI